MTTPFFEIGAQRPRYYLGRDWYEFADTVVTNILKYMEYGTCTEAEMDELNIVESDGPDLVSFRGKIIGSLGEPVAGVPTIPQIKTNHDYPPIPVRNMDWSAWYDGLEESGPYGHGATEAEAIADLKDNYEVPVLKAAE